MPEFLIHLISSLGSLVAHPHASAKRAAAGDPSTRTCRTLRSALRCLIAAQSPLPSLTYLSSERHDGRSARFRRCRPRD